MRFHKGLAAASGAAVLAAGGIGVVALHGGDEAPKRPSAQVSPANSVPATAEDVIRSITGITQQTQTAAATGHPMTREEVDALVKQQLAQLGIKS